ncbi:MAG TPA: hypothetical protein ENG42_03415 [Candidatus Aenigmarchaeota archaeon]|nr:MAG: hypothetical protein DRP03_02185 [Candidatus Aenigmarchaeota archaeon]HDD46500.1 hypothetical protein [Candidatus Aenigmarchaeota archaeon]
MTFPKEVLTKTKSGNIEVRVFLKRGEFVHYGYMDVKTKKMLNKAKIILKSENGKVESYFIIPLKQKDKFLLMKEKEQKTNIKLWDGKKSISLWGD